MENFTKFILHYIEKTEIHGVKGWFNQLQAYKWKTNLGVERYPEGIKTTNFFLQNSRKILNSSNHEDLWYLHCDNIRKWGGMIRTVPPSLALEFENCVKFLLNNNPDTNSNLDKFQICGKRIAMASKIYYFSDPLRWTIYDSRVGYALHQLISEYAKIQHIPPTAIIPHTPLCLPESKTTRRNPVFSVSRCFDAEINSLKSFIWASYLHRLLAEKLNESLIEKPSHCLSIIPQWELPHVEMVFFVIGDRKWVDSSDIADEKKQHSQSFYRGDYAGVCPLCGYPLKIRKSRMTGELYKGCTNYPSCRYKGDRSH